MILKDLSDKELLNNTKTLVQSERELLTEILLHLREIQRRRLYSHLKIPSLFAYCTQVLKYSESQAQRRIVAMRMIVEIPQIEEKVTSGELSLSNVVQAKSFFNQEEKTAPLNLHDKIKILEELQDKTSREGEKILLARSSSPLKFVSEKFKQVTPEITEIKFGADEKLIKKINRVKGLLAHRKPNLSISELVDELCEMALNKLDLLRKEIRRVGENETKKSMPKVIPPAPKVVKRPYIDVKTKREVWHAAEGKCKICNSVYALEIDHEVPLRIGGSSEIENLRLLCRNCNQREAVKKLGRNLMDGYIN